jgi:hypothetical protein
VKISLSNPERPDIEAQSIEATINTGARASLVSRSLLESMALPQVDGAETKTYACIEYSGSRSVIELVVSDTASSVVLSQAALMAMGVEFDSFTGIPILHA